MALLHSATGWWIDEAGAPDPRPPFTGFGSADVVIVGGGYLGMWTAWHLLQRDPSCDVMLVEAGRCGHGPSGRNGGFVNGYWSHAPALAASFGADRAVRAAQEADASIHAIGEFCKREKVDAWYRPAPQVDISTAPAQDGSWREEVEGLRALGHGEEYSELTRSQVQQICRSPVFRAAAASRTAATVQPARLAFGLRAALLRRGARIYEDTEATAIEARGAGVRVSTRAAGERGADDAGGSRPADGGRGYVDARTVVLAAGWQTLRWPGFARELTAASSHIVLTEPVPDVLERIGWTGGEPLADCRRMLHYFRTTNDGRIAFGWGGGRVAHDARQDPRLELDAEVVDRAAAALRRFFPLLKDRAVTHAWGGPIDVAPNRLPIYRTRGAVHAGWGFTGHGVGPSHLGGRILSGLALGVRDEVTTLPLVEPPVKSFPPEPARWLGGSLIRSALIRKDLLDEHGRRVDPVTRAVASLPRLLGLNLPR